MPQKAGEKKPLGTAGKRDFVFETAEGPAYDEGNHQVYLCRLECVALTKESSVGRRTHKRTHKKDRMGGKGSQRVSWNASNVVKMPFSPPSFIHFVW